jgi:hypothetical protein
VRKEPPWPGQGASTTLFGLDMSSSNTSCPTTAAHWRLGSARGQHQLCSGLGAVTAAEWARGGGRACACGASPQGRSRFERGQLPALLAVAAPAPAALSFAAGPQPPVGLAGADKPCTVPAGRSAPGDAGDVGERGL